MKKIISVVGARPNFMKIAPLHRELLKYPDQIIHKICHTGQHYDEKMSKVFFIDLDLPKPDFYLGVGSGSHAEQTAKVMIEFEKIVINERPDLVIVVGDVNSTVACSLVSVKMGVPVAHVEAGLRSFDRAMPEEINRIVTDSISDILFVTEQSGIDNLLNEGVNKTKINFVGNVMIDSLIHLLPKTKFSKIKEVLSVEKGNYIVATLHRPSNVDTKESLESVLSFLSLFAENQKIIFPIHPRTRKNISIFELEKNLSSNIILTEPLSYIDFIALMKDSSSVFTDSGGIQEETTMLGIPCITLRRTTERPITVSLGTNYLVGTDFFQASKIAKEVIFNKQSKVFQTPPLWDGKAAERIVENLRTVLGII